MRTTTRAAAAVAATLIGLTAAGCGPADRAGGTATARKVTLTLANVNSEPDLPLQAWAEQVRKDSDGTLEIAWRNGYLEGDPAQERRLIEDVGAGTVEGGWAGTRAFGPLGVHSFDPLLAPFLVDSYELERAVFDAGIPARMLTGLDALDVHGVGVLPGPLKKVVSFGRPLTSAAAFRGITVAANDTGVIGATFTALGATAQPIASGESPATDAVEQHLAAVAGNTYEEKGATSVTGNLNLWPRALVLFVSDQAWSRLSADQRTVLTGAAGPAADAALTATVDEDAASAAGECTYGLPMVQASDEELAGLRRAVQPVYDTIGAEPEGRAGLDRIDALKADLGAPPSAAVCERSTPPTAGSGALDGTYTAHLDPSDGCQDLPPGGVDLLLVLDGGVMRQYGAVPGDPIGPDAPESLGDKGTYSVYRDRLQIDDGGVFSMRWRLDGDTLTLSDLDSSCDTVEVFTASPWTRR